LIILPNKYERYTAALRNSVQSSILKKGITLKHLKRLRKIYEAEAILGYKNIAPVNLSVFFNSLLLSAYIKLLQKDLPLDFFIEVYGNFLINRKLLTALLLNLCCITNKIKIYYEREKIVIECQTENKVKPVILKALKAVHFYEIKTKKYIIIISAEKTAKDSLKTEKEWDILNPFSPVNIYLI